jgi:hypothetical protein
MNTAQIAATVVHLANPRQKAREPKRRRWRRLFCRDVWLDPARDFDRREALRFAIRSIIAPHPEGPTGARLNAAARRGTRSADDPATGGI